MTGDELIKLTADEVASLLSPAQVIGTPLEIGDKVVIPLVHFGFGFGAGSGQSKEKGAEGSGAGGGGGISPIALVIVHKEIPGPEGIEVVSLRRMSAVAQVISDLTESITPQIIDAVKEMAGRKKEE
ncbi:MAG: sporulation protein [Methanoregulaceae archaeon]|nr:sporulation protein [Methanoregulaceae archaeon]